MSCSGKLILAYTSIRRLQLELDFAFCGTPSRASNWVTLIIDLTSLGPASGSGETPNAQYKE